MGAQKFIRNNGSQRSSLIAKFKRSVGVTVCLGLLAVSSPMPAKAEVGYVYDDLGRLVRTVRAPSGEVVEYDYDPAGNRTERAIFDANIFKIDDAASNEGDSTGQTLTFTVTRVTPTGTAFTIDFATQDDLAVVGDDFLAAGTSGSLSFGTTDTSKTITITTVPENMYEYDESFFVVLSSSDPNVSFLKEQGIGSITNDDPVPTITVADVTVNEGDTAQIDIVMSNPSAYPIDFAMITKEVIEAQLAAAFGSDHGFVSQPVTIEPGEVSKTINVPTYTDGSFELSEEVKLAISGLNGMASLGALSSLVNITNIDPAPTVTAQNVTVTEGGDMRVDFVMTGYTDLEHAYDFAVQGIGSSWANIATDLDTTNLPSNVAFAVDENLTKTVTVTIPTVEEGNYEHDELFELQILNGSNSVGTLSLIATATINNITLPPTFVTEEAIGLEGNDVDFTVTRIGGSEVQHDLTYSTVPGTDPAYDPAEVTDFTGVTNAVLSFLPGDIIKTISVPTVAEGNYEAIEQIKIAYAGVSNQAVLDALEVIGQIQNIDTTEFSIPTASVDEAGNLQFDITLSNPSEVPQTIDYATIAQTALAGVDYSAVAQAAFSFAPMVTTQSVSVVSLADTIQEGDETFDFQITNASGGATIATETQTGTILDDDSTLTINNVSVSEGGNLVFTVTRTNGINVSHNVSYATANGSAATGDYTARSGTLTFAAGQSTKTITVPTVEDSTYENSDTVLVNLSNPTNDAVIADSQGVGTITNDDAAPAFSVNNAPYRPEGNTHTFTISKSGATAFTHNVDYYTTTGSAGASDFTAKSGTLSFTSGQTSKTVTVVSTEDSIYESSESFYLHINNATNGATIAGNYGHTFIQNDDYLPVAVADYLGVLQYEAFVWNLTANDTDANGDSLTITSVGSWPLGTITIVSASSVSFYGTISGAARAFTYTITDGHTGTSSVTSTCAVAPEEIIWPW